MSQLRPSAGKSKAPVASVSTNSLTVPVKSFSLKNRGVYSEELCSSSSEASVVDRASKLTLSSSTASVNLGRPPPAQARFPVTQFEYKAPVVNAIIEPVEQSSPGEEPAAAAENTAPDQEQPVVAEQPVLADDTSERLTFETSKPEQRYPESATEPKVYVPFEQVPGHPPRRIEIERKKKIFATQDIHQLLRDKDVPFDAEDDEKANIYTCPYNVLPLSVFDDNDFEVRAVPQWLDMGRDENGAMIGLPGLGLSNGAFWSCRIFGHNNEEEMWQIEWDESMDPDCPRGITEIARINLLFVAEDPFNFANRVAAAHQARADALALMRYQLSLECMPTDDIPQLDQEQVNRVLSSALNTDVLKKGLLDTTSLLNEVNINHTCTMNRITFNKQHADNDSEMVKTLTLPKNPPPPAVPAKGVLSIPASNFPENFSNFTFNSFLTKPEIIDAMTQLRAECNRMMEVELFNLKNTKSQTLEDFEGQQNTSRTAGLKLLRDSWPTSVKNIIRSSFKTIGKGWFNLEETSIEMYQLSKLKCFMMFVNFVMQDSLRFLTEDSLRAYCSLVQRACNGSVIVNTTSNVTLTFEGAEDEVEADQLKRRPPMFAVTLEADEETNVFKYSTDPSDFCIKSVSVFDTVVLKLKDIVKAEKLVMDKLFWSHEPLVESVHQTEDWVLQLRDTIKKGIEQSIAPLNEYLAKYEEHLELLALDVDAYMAEIEEENFDEEDGLDVKAIVQLAEKHGVKEKAIKDSIPDGVNLGVVAVDTSGVRTLLSDKHADVVTRLRDLLASKTNEDCFNINQEFETIHRRLSEIPDNIEALVDLQNFMEGVPQAVKDLEPNLEINMKTFAQLDALFYQLERDQFYARYRAFGWPLNIAKKMEEVHLLLESEKKVYAEVQEEEQQHFEQNIESLGNEVNNLHSYKEIEKVATTAEYIRDMRKRLDDAQEKADVFNTREVLFAKDVTEYTLLAKVKKDFEPYYNLWQSADDWFKMSENWMGSPVLDIDAEELEKKMTTLARTMNKTKRYFDKAGVQGCSAIAEKVKAKVDEFAPNVPLVTAMCNPGMRDRHWQTISEKTGKDVTPGPDFTLNKVIEMDLLDHVEAIVKVGEAAGKEYGIETALDKMEEEWQPVDLLIEPYRNTGSYILKGFDEYMALLDEQITLTQAMAFSTFKGPFEERIEQWDHKLQVISEVFDEWVAVQRNWLYLQPIFDSPDINKQLPTEGKRFATVDKTWRQTMAAAKSNPKALKFCANEKLLQKFKESNKFLDMVQKGLSDYLETKRAAFSRFYFLSNDELLEILSQTKDPTKVQPHLAKCFEGIKSVDFESDQTVIAMNSREKEKIPLATIIDPKGKNIEVWMVELNQVMVASVREQMYKAVLEYPKVKRTDWMLRWPGMVVLNGSQMHWTLETERALDKHGNKGLADYYQQLLGQLNDMVELVRGKLSKMARTTIGALAVIDVHARDVMLKMVEAGVCSSHDFDWMAQMRFYWDPSDDHHVPSDEGNLFVQMVASRRRYGYEYLGNSFRLVITPLTDKCYLTIMGALQMILGGAPAGPAGTGKTETTKDLAKALAKQCVVFNCSDGLDYLAMGKFFKGLASSGAWACFDEFNRINIEVLSVIAGQLITLQGTVRRGEDRVFFEDREIYVNEEFAPFITMNPGYAGRTELPDNLQALFRPVAMMVPDYALIGEIMLFSFGFLAGRSCAKKMVATFKLCSEQLSSQSHYDYGMRAVKTVIMAAGNLKQADPDMEELSLLMRALQDVNLPKFLAHDLPLFAGIMSDLFPGVQRPPADYGPLNRALKLAIEERGLQPMPWFMKKNIELYEMICVRHGLMVVGPTGGGKSNNVRVLQNALTRLSHEGIEGIRYNVSHVHHLNPKSITMGQLYGEFDPNTHEWQDGILATMIRNCIRDTSIDGQWVLFDGPVDAIWIENMNTVLDDNKKLCLTSGEIMALSDPMTMMFEPEDLEVASPATVSRCGMIYMEPHSLGYECLIVSWMEKLPKCLEKSSLVTLKRLFDSYVPSCINILRRNLFEPLGSTDNMLIENCMKLMDCYLDDFREREGVDPKSSSEVQRMDENMEPLFIFCLIWSLCCSVDMEGRMCFDNFVRSEMMSQSSSKPIPADGLIYDYIYDLQTQEWTGWMDTITPYKYDPKLSYSELIIPTLDSVRYSYLFKTFIENKKHVLMCGPTGTGKTINIQNTMATGFNDKYVPLCLSFSAQTSANQTQDTIDGKCEKRRKGVFGPTAGKQFIVFVDDMNMPQKETYGAQPPIEILRQWFDNSGWFDRATLVFRKIIDCIFTCACGPPGGGRNPVTERFTRHFNLITYTPMQDSSMALIFETIVGNFLSGGFAEGLPEMTHGIVRATIDVYNTILSDLRPTPAKSHYTYNLRDISKVFQGLLMCNKSRVGDKGDLARMWLHELRRQFADRLINNEDLTWFIDLCKDKLKHDLDMEWDDVVVRERLICGDYLVMGADPRIYEEVKDLGQLQTLFEEYLSEYNQDSKQPMHLVMFMDAIEHVSRISRVIRQPQGNALLLGVGGSGRQSVTKLATSMAEFDLYRVEIAKGYSRTDWLDNLRECLLMAGIENKPVVFLFNDVQVVFESMLEDINGVLNAGDVPNLYQAEHMDTIMTTCKPDCVKKRIPPTKLNIYNQYIHRVRSNIHICMCMSPVGESFRTRLRMFPSFVNCSTIDWFTEWPDEALQHVAMADLSDPELKLGDSLNGCVNFVKNCHLTVSATSKEFLEKARRHNYVTPTSYLEMLATYVSLLNEKRVEVGTMRSRLQTGLDKIITTAEQVGGLQEQLVAMEPVLIQTQKEVDEMIVQIGIDKEAAGETKTIVSAEEEVATKKASETKAIADDAQRDLDEALPALDAAVACLNKLKKADIDEVKSLKTPPAGVKLTMEATCIMFKIKPVKVADPDNPGKKINDYWDAAKKHLLKDANQMLASLFNFDKDNIPPDVIHKIEPYTVNEGFTPKAIEKASKACTAICMWVLAMHKYHTVAEAVEPKKKLLAEAQVELDETMQKLQVAQAKLKAVEDRIADLEANYETANTKKEQLVTDVENCRARLERAQKLIGGLGGERTRWTETCAQLAIDFDHLVGDVLISAGYIAYLGPFTPTFRRSIAEDWQVKLKELELPNTDGCTLQTTLADPVKMRSWNIAGLPTDGHSSENGIIMSKSRRWSLLMDPQGQANKYIKNMGKDANFSPNGLDITKLTDKNFLRTLENGVRFGKWVLLENIQETLDAALEPLLLQQKFIQGGTEMIKIGDSVIPYNNDFRFYMTTKLPNPHYAPEVCVKVSLLNFTITPAGLEDQLLGVTVVVELPEMEEKKNALVVANARMAGQLKDIEDKILYMLANSTGNILDDHELIETLADSKVTSNEIKVKVAEAEVTEKEIDETREKYRPFAERGSILYFSIASLCQVDPMYQYSLQWFTQLFIKAIQDSEMSDELEHRLEILKEFFTYYLYVNVCRSLFEKDKLLFSFVMAVKILEHAGKIDHDEWMFLITGKTAHAVEADNPNPEWIDTRMWTEVTSLAYLPQFKDFETEFVTLIDAWKGIFDSATPEEDPLPGKWNTHLNSLQKLMVLRALRPDMVSIAIQTYVSEMLAPKFVTPPPFNLEACYADSSNMTPLIFILVQGSDPTKAYMEFAEKNKMSKKSKSLSLGQGQGPVADNMLKEGVGAGSWVYLQNCHLYISWMPILEQKVEELDPDQTHKDFRLWLTSMPSKGFPVSILQNGVKMTNEPPKGLRANLKSAYFKLSDETLKITTKPNEYRKLLFGLCLFHACVQERRKYGALGWNIPYQFNDTDLDISKSQLEMFLDQYDFIPYQVLNFLTSYINYGGRVTDYIDLRTIDVILKSYYNENAIKDGHKFTPDGIYRSIEADPEKPHADYMDYIEGLPLNAGPQVFGMHSNANIAAANAETFGIFGTIALLEASGGGGGGGGGNAEALIEHTAKQIQDKCPPLFVLEEIGMQYPIMYEESMNTVLGQECIRYNKLLGEMHATLPELRKALQGLVVMSNELEAMGNAMKMNKVPGNWAAKAYPSLKPLGSWVQELWDRVAFIIKWIAEGIPPCFWITGFYFPQAFLTGSLQNFARKFQLPIDTVDFNFIMMDVEHETIKKKPDDGVYIRGLYLEGARWNPDKKSLDESRPKQLYTEMPVIHLDPEQHRKDPGKGVYRCPVYKELSRRGVLSTTGHSTNFIFWIDVPSDREDSLMTPENGGKSDQITWILSGVGAFCSLKF